MNQLKNKKAVEPVIATVLLIVIVIVAVALIVAFVIPMIRESMDKAKACGPGNQVELEYAKQNLSSRTITVRISRGSSDFTLEGIILQMTNSTTAKIHRQATNISAYEADVITFSWPGAADSVGIAPVIKLVGKDKPIECDIQGAIPVEQVS